MADGYMVVREHEEDGMFWGDPLVFDTKAEAIEVAKQITPPPGYVWALYAINYVCDPTEAE